MLHDEAMLVRRDRTRDLAAVLASRLDAHHRATGPLPWLPPVPRQLAEDDFWGRYFDRRHELIQRHGTAVRAAATSGRQQTAPAWAVPTLSDARPHPRPRDLAGSTRHPRYGPAPDRTARERSRGQPAQRQARPTRRRSRRTPDAHSNRRRPGSPKRSTPASPPTRNGRPRPPDRRGPPSWHRPRRAATHRHRPTASDRTARRGARVPPHRRYRRAPDIAARAAAQARRTMPVRAKAAACAAARPRPHGRTDAERPSRSPPVSRGSSVLCPATFSVRSGLRAARLSLARIGRRGS